MSFIKKNLITIIFFLFILIIFLYRVVFSYNYDSDFGRDLMWMYDILHGKITLLGPKLSFGGYYVGPYYYYIFAPFLFLSGYSPNLVIIANSFFSALFLTILFSK